MSANQNSPKHQLVGITLSSGWKIVHKFEPSENSTGGNFGVGYRATRGDDIAFVKAVDFVGAMSDADPILKLQQLTSESIFERDVLEYCAQRGMSKVLKYIDHEYVLPPGFTNPFERVSCLVMEAGSTDLRNLLSDKGLSNCSWNLKVISDVSEAITQLHKGGIAHQDVKPSNIIKENSSDNMKIGDLGRVVRKDQAGPFDGWAWPGDRRYWPPEGWYQYRLPDWNDAREAMDAYMLGSLIFFLYTGVSLQSQVSQYIPEKFWPGNWQGGFDSTLIPVLIDAHYQCINRHLRPAFDESIADTMVEVTIALVHPDPRVRGDKRARATTGRPVGIDRIHQKIRAAALTCAAFEKGRARR